MQRPLLALVLLACACSQKSLAAADAGAPPPPLAPGFLGTTEPDALRPGARPVDVALGDAQRPCALLTSGEVWCWSLAEPAAWPGRVPGTWEKRADAIRAEGGRLLIRAGGEYSLFHGHDPQRSAARRRAWYRHGPVALGTAAPTTWRCDDHTCLVATARTLTRTDETTATPVPPPARCAGVAPDLFFAPEHADEPWLVRCGAQAVLFATSSAATVARPVTGLPAGARVVGWRGSGRAEVQAPDGKLGVYVTPIAHDFAQAEWTAGAPQPFSPSTEAETPALASAPLPPCRLDGSEVVCLATAPPALAERARKLAASFPSAPRALWTRDDAACAWGDLVAPEWALRCVTLRDDAPRNVTF